ncbi:MAG TPA: hypothetical protein VKU90_15595 [Caulobacteraceae bacterium]|nr:hypothetical protein [Caulobacteraceae bacterium]
MRRPAAILAAVALMGAAPAPELADAFIRLCGDTHGDADQAAARAEAAGWTTPKIPLAVVAAMVPGVTASNLKARTWTPAGHVWLLLAGSIEAKGRAQRSCTVAETNVGDFAAVRGAVKDWVGLPPLASRDNGSQVVFAFIDTAHGRTPGPAGYDPLAKGAPAGPLASAVVLTRAGGLEAITYAPL